MDQGKIGRFIAVMRKQQGMTQELLGERLGVTNKTISRWEAGKYMPDIDKLRELSMVLDISVNELLAGERIEDSSNFIKKADENLITVLSCDSSFSLQDRISEKEASAMNELYGVFKKFSYNNHYVNLTKTLNSAHTTKETQKTLRYITEPTEGRMAHGGVLAIHKGICYTTYIHNYGEGGDNPFCKTLVLELGIFSLNRALSEDFDPQKDIKVICFEESEEITGGIEFTSSFICNSLHVVEDKLHITLGAQIKGERFALYHSVYDTEAGTFTRAKEARLLYKDKIYPMDDVHINKITIAEGYESRGEGMPQITNRWSEYKGYYYTTFMIDSGLPKRALVIRTRDFDTMEFVSIVPDSENCSAEIASCIYTDQLYTACRQFWGTPFAIMNRYDLETGKWLKSYKIEDGTSRPWFFIYKDEVYLYNTVEETDRRYANLSKVRTDRKAHNHKTAPIDTVATLYNCGSYHSFFVYEDRIYFVCTLAHSLRFGELKLIQYDAEKVNDKLLELFAE